MVELLGGYSNSGRELGGLRRLVAVLDRGWSEPQSEAAKPARRLSMRLTPEQQERLIRDYEAGVSGLELAERHGLARSAVIHFLRGHGVTIRQRRFTEAEAQKIVELYRAGMRQVDIARQMGRDKGAVWDVLRWKDLV